MLATRNDPDRLGLYVAHTMVQQGLRLDEIITRADLHSGLQWALQRQELAVQPLANTRATVDKGP